MPLDDSPKLQHHTQKQALSVCELHVLYTLTCQDEPEYQTRLTRMKSGGSRQDLRQSPRNQSSSNEPLHKGAGRWDIWSPIGVIWEYSYGAQNNTAAHKKCVQSMCNLRLIFILFRLLYLNFKIQIRSAVSLLTTRNWTERNVYDVCPVFKFLLWFLFSF